MSIVENRDHPKTVSKFLKKKGPFFAAPFVG